MSRYGEHSVTLCRGQPGRLCAYCGGSVYGRTRCKRRTCPSYARLWALDWRIVLLENLIAYDGKAVMYTITPPGADQLPWDRSKCSHSARIPCSGPHGCVIEDEARRRWNESFQRRLSRIYETAQAAVKREVGIRANVLTIGKEAQKRGAIHGHFVMKAAREVAAYLSSYFVRGRGHKAPLAEAVTNGELPRLPLYVSRRLTSVTRTTMRNKRRQRHLHVCDSRGLSKPPWWQDERERADVLALSLPVRDRLRLFAELGRAVVP